MLEEKYNKLRQELSSLNKVLVAFSGGVDSTFLLYAAKKALGESNVLAVIAESPTYPRDEIELAQKVCQGFGVNYQIIRTDEFLDHNFVSNPKDRCYFCKKELFSKLLEIARENGIEHVLDGSNFDDKADYRPGGKAKSELGVKSPLMELGFTKQEIRDLSKEEGLPTWDKPSYACLASRIPYGTEISKKLLARINKGEEILKSEGFRHVRLRHYQDLCRIELAKNEIPRLIKCREHIVDRLKDLGYNYITVDLEGYRTGSLNTPHLRAGNV